MSAISKLAMNDEGFAFDPMTGACYTLNQTGLRLLQWLREGRRQEDIPHLLAESYDVSEDSAARDATDFCLRLKTLKLA